MGTLKIRVGGQSIAIPRGPKGDTGPANVLTKGTVTTGAPGSAADVTISGTSPNQTIDFTIPRGDTGATGPAGGVNSVNGKSGAVTLAYSELAGYSEKTNTVTTTATTTLDCSLAMTHVVNQTMNTTLAITNVDQTASRASSVSVVLKQDATGGRTIGWPSGTKWPMGVAPTLTTTANAINVVTFMTIDGGTTWFGFLAGAGMA